ncbi:MAG: 3-deoxy-8-phosphooctulonate synthase [Candidatus Lambdaproteobacteria bacterium]|nr:3-deoxy-8-phosphooctulonate synthase [Candidatus Lambdaproteobacteria bacterium]
MFDLKSFHRVQLPLFALAGPDVIEDEVRPGQTLAFARRLKAIGEEVGVPLAFKVSYDKANRTGYHSFRGPGLAGALELFRAIRHDVGIPLLSDVHRFEEIEPAAEVLDILQVPAFLCRQTDFVVEIARTGRIVNWKKGQFIAPRDVEHAIGKMTAAGNERIIITERGYMFGYNNLVVDMRGFAIMKQFGFPVVIDATHSIQLPSGGGGKSAGERQFVAPIAQAAVAAGADGVFMETHEDPEIALCDGPNMIPLAQVAALLKKLQAIHALVRE